MSCPSHYIDVILTTVVSQITSVRVVYSIVYSDADQRKTSKLSVTGHCGGISPGPVNSPHKGPVTRKMFPFDDAIMKNQATSMDNANQIYILLNQFLKKILNLLWSEIHYITPPAADAWPPNRRQANSNDHACLTVIWVTKEACHVTNKFWFWWHRSPMDSPHKESVIRSVYAHWCRVRHICVTTLGHHWFR